MVPYVLLFRVQHESLFAFKKIEHRTDRFLPRKGKSGCFLQRSDVVEELKSRKGRELGVEDIINIH